jgi:uroporphyrinogen III methyltransferase/synthase
MVDVVEAYRTVTPSNPKAAPESYDWVTFTSSSTVKNFIALAGRPKGRVASIGPITSSTLRMHGIEPDVEANEYTTEGLIAAIVRHHQRK